MHARINGDEIQLLTRTGLDWSPRYERTIEALRSLRVKSAYLDGELCALKAPQVERRTRALCVELAHATGGGAQRWCALDMIAQAVGQDHDTASAAVAYAIGKNWMLAGGTPPHSISLTEAGRVLSAASKRKPRR
jgi:hypothetical protein